VVFNNADLEPDADEKTSEPCAGVALEGSLVQGSAISGKAAILVVKAIAREILRVWRVSLAKALTLVVKVGSSWSPTKGAAFDAAAIANAGGRVARWQGRSSCCGT